MATASRKPAPTDPTRDIEELLKGCRRDGGNPIIGRVVRQANGQERILIILLADASPFYFRSLSNMKGALMRYLHADDLKIQETIKDPLVAEAIRLGGRVIGWSQ